MQSGGKKWEQPEVSVRNAPVAAADSVKGSEKGKVKKMKRSVTGDVIEKIMKCKIR